MRGGSARWSVAVCPRPPAGRDPASPRCRPCPHCHHCRLYHLCRPSRWSAWSWPPTRWRTTWPPAWTPCWPRPTGTSRWCWSTTARGTAPARSRPATPSATPGWSCCARPTRGWAPPATRAWTRARGTWSPSPTRTTPFRRPRTAGWSARWRRRGPTSSWARWPGGPRTGSAPGPGASSTSAASRSPSRTAPTCWSTSSPAPRCSGASSWSGWRCASPRASATRTSSR